MVGRSALPPRDEWSQILEQDDSDGPGRKLRKIQALEAAGAEVLALAADVADQEQMQQVVEQAIARFGTIHGVIHAAGVPGMGLIPLKTPDMVAKVLAPKVLGTLVLEHVLQQIALDFMVLCSSITSATGGGPGQIDYCAANAFLDAYAQRNAARHGRTIAINWGEWQWNAWEEGLAGYDTATQTFFRENRRKFGIAFDEGADALGRVLALRYPQVIVSTQDFRVIVELSKSFTTQHLLRRTEQEQRSRPLHPRPTLGTLYDAPRNEVEQKIAAIWGEMLGIEGVGISDNFFELGGNSLIGIDLIARLKKEFAIESIPAYVLYEAPSVGAMAQFLDQKCKKMTHVEERLDRGARRRERQEQRRRGA